MGLQTEPGEEIEGTGVAIYFVDEHALDTFGLNLLAGENFSVTEVEWRERGDTSWPGRGMITRAMAESLFPDDPDSALGKTVYINDQAIQIVDVSLGQIVPPASDLAALGQFGGSHLQGQAKFLEVNVAVPAELALLAVHLPEAQLVMPLSVTHYAIHWNLE